MSAEVVFPSYLLSHALSTAHYSFLKRADAAASSHELDRVCQTEIDRLRALIAKGKLSDASTKEALVLLMAIADRTSTPGHHLALGLVPALNIATAAKDTTTKSIGYLYLSENLAASNEISLLLFNTVLKDLESSHVPSIALALRSIISVPSADIAPAVEHQLTHLVSHKSSNIRRLALAALLALSSVASPDVLAGLKDRKLWKRLEDSDPAVVVHAVRVLSKMESVRLVDTAVAFPAVLRTLQKIIGRPRSEATHLPLKAVQLALLKATADMLDRLDPDQLREFSTELGSFLTAVVEDAALDALVLPVYSILSRLSDKGVSSPTPLSLRPIQRALLSSQPNGHLWALECLAFVPVSVWAGDADNDGLGEEAMGALMGGLDSRDQGVRVATLKILHSLSPELIALQLGRIVSLLASSSSSSPGVRAQEASVGQALEIIELTFASVDQEDGAEAAGKVWEVLEATHSADATEIVLEESAGRLLAWVGHRPTLWQASFSSSLLVLASASARRPSPTSSIVIAAAACEFNASTPGPADTSRLLASLLQGTSSASIQEALLLSLAGVCTRLDGGRPERSVLDVVERLRSASGRHLTHRCDAFLLIAASSQAFLPLNELISDHSLPSVLRAFESHSRTLAPPTRLSRRDDKSPLTASPSSRSRDLSASTLRYGAYPSASEEEATRKLEKRHRKERRELEREERRKSERARADQAGDESAVGVTAGELALLELEERELAIETRSATVPDDEDDDTDPFKTSPKKSVGAELISLGGGSSPTDQRA